MDETTLEYCRRMAEAMNARSLDEFKLPMRRYSDEELARLLFKQYGIQVRHRQNRQIQLDEYTQEKLRKIVSWINTKPTNNLLIYGAPGTGKTTMLKAIASMIGTKARFIEAQEIYNHFTENHKLPSFTQTPVVLIDDLGAEPLQCNDFGVTRQPLTELLLERYTKNGVTIIASNFNLKMIGEMYGQRVAERMQEAYSRLVYSDDKNYRKI